MKALTINETQNFKRNIDPKEAMKTGNLKIADFQKLKKYQLFIQSTKKFEITKELPSLDTMIEEYTLNWDKNSRDENGEPILYYSFSFSALEEIGPDCKYCTNDFHYGEIGHFVVEYEVHTGDFYIVFQNNGDSEEIENLSDIKKYLGLN